MLRSDEQGRHAAGGQRCQPREEKKIVYSGARFNKHYCQTHDIVNNIASINNKTTSKTLQKKC